MEEKKRVLAIGAHPDDIELGCGGAIAKHLERGDEVYVLVMTYGEKGAHVPDMKECFASLENLGIKRENMIFGNFPDTFVPEDSNAVSFIEGVINKFKINRVYTHTPRDRHQDHRNCSLASSSAARKIGEIFLYQSPSTRTDFQPHYFISFNKKHYDKKISSLQCYKTQVDKGIVNLNAISALCQWWGAHNGAEYAEAFEVNHIVRGENEI